MPTFWGITGTAVASHAETALLTGTATASATPSPYLLGTGVVDRASLVAWGANVRRTATRVFLGAESEDLTRIQGDVSIDIDSASPVATASFTLTDPRCAYHATDSIATGGIPVAIRCRVSVPTATADTAVFRGLTEAAPSAGAYVPTAQIQCAGEGEEWLAEKGCLNLAAFAGYTRIEALRGFAESVDIDSDRIAGGDDWAEIQLPLDLSGLSTWELARRFAWLEDSYVRNNGGDLEILDARDVVNGSPIYDFTPATYFSTAETPANRPTTRLVLSTVGIPEEILTAATEETTAQIEGGTDALGVQWEIRTETTTVNGVTIRERIEEWRDIAIPGVTPSAVAWRLWKLTETETDWGTVTVNGVSLRTARIDEQRTTITEWYSAPCRSSSGYVWDDGTRHVANAATWQVTEERVTTYTYDAAPSCLLSAKTTAVGGWYSPIVASGHAYDGGEERLDTVYQWIAPTATPPYELIEETYSEETSDTLRAVNSSTTTSGWRVPPGSASVAEVWGERTGSTARWSTTPGSGVIAEATATLAEDGSTTYASKVYAGELPGLARAAADVPQYRTVPLVLTATADSGSPAVAPVTETVWGAESLADLQTYARRRFREEHSPRVTILHPAIPFLKVLDVVTVTDPKLELDEAEGYVERMRLVLNASTTGRLSQETTVCFPLSQFDPEVA